MTYHLKREVVDGVVNISLGMPEADAYLKFVRDRCRLNTVLSYGYDLQIFLNFIRKPLLDVTSADILAFVESQPSAPNVWRSCTWNCILRIIYAPYPVSAIIPLLSFWQR